jgi:thiosulfate/3-mercaptopyruvate sulfurtransferase
MPYIYPCGGEPVRLVSTEWLAEHPCGEDVMIVDAQPNIHDFILEHIPGAIYLPEGYFRTHRGRQPARFATREIVQPVLSGAGLRPDTTVVVYTGIGGFKGWGDGLEQTMVAFCLALYGHNDVCVLDGGLDKWKAEGKPLAKEYPETVESAFPVEVRDSYCIGYEEFTAIKDRDDVVLLDARPPALYEGQGPWLKPGHIPGAVNVPWQSLMDDANKTLLKSEEDVMEILTAGNVAPEKTIICSCGTGREATNEFLLLKFYLGYPDVRHHEGGFTEWVSYPDNKTVTGKRPR